MKCHLSLALLLIILAGPAAMAWNKPGHMVTGAIAYDLLKRDHPEDLPRIVAALHQHPQYDELWAKKLEDVEEDQRDRYLFMLAARWPDDVRRNRRYHHGPWHYINYPIVAPADVGQLQPPAPAEPNVLTALKENLATGRDDVDPAKRAVAICWMFHLIGDVHQPLHATAYFSRQQWPKGDKGGNDFYIRVAANRAVINLHSLWDGLILGSERYQSVSNVAIELRNRPEFARDKLTELAADEPEQWAQESVKIAAETGYRNGTLEGSANDTEGPVLPDGYTSAAKAVAERRVVLAGYRLAERLHALTATTQPAPSTTQPGGVPATTDR